MDEACPVSILRPRSAPIPAMFSHGSEALEAAHQPRSLIVDDCHFVTRRLAQALEARGYRCVLASDGRTGLELARAEHFDLIMLDVDMPIVGGLSMLRQLRHDPNHDTTPILVLSDDESGWDRVRALSLGANGYLTKPLQLRPLYATLDSIL